MTLIKTAADLIAEAQAQIKCLDITATKALFEAAEHTFILDVREAGSADDSKLSDSVNISRGLIEMKIPKLCPDPDTLILIHCGGGGRASLATLTLQEMGYTNVHAIMATFDDLKKTFG